MQMFACLLQSCRRLECDRRCPLQRFRETDGARSCGPTTAEVARVFALRLPCLAARTEAPASVAGAT